MSTPADQAIPGSMGCSPRTLLSVEAAADQLSIGRTTMYALIKAGHITTVRIGRLRRVPAEALTTYTAHLLAEQNAEQNAA